MISDPKPAILFDNRRVSFLCLPYGLIELVEKYFSKEISEKEKSELINMMMQAKNKGLKTQPVKKKEKELLHCDSMDNEI